MDERKKDSECWESESWEDKSTKENDKDDEKPPREWKRTRTKLRIWQWRRRRPQRRHQVKTKVITTMTIATTKSTMKTYGVWRNRGKCWINVKKKEIFFFDASTSLPCFSPIDYIRINVNVSRRWEARKYVSLVETKKWKEITVKTRKINERLEEREYGS